jgi:protein phosphatase
MITIIGATHPGQREHNEDCYAADEGLGLGLVADGMGGYACGEVASALVKTSIEQAAANDAGLSEAILSAHQAVRAAADLDASKQGMGSTAIAVKMDGLDYELAWVGDSRAYLWDGSSELKQITRDHSYVESLLTTGVISYEEAINHPNRNLITQAVGVATETGLEVGCVRGRLVAGQQLLLCSDGLVDEVLDVDIARLMNQATNPEEALNSLVRAAVVAGGHDNITVVIVTVDERAENTAAAIEPEIVRSTSIDSRPEEPTQPRPEPQADITRLGMPIVEDDDCLELAAMSRWQAFSEFIALNIPLLLISFSAAILLTLAIYYFG